jgi:hypothetical protein
MTDHSAPRAVFLILTKTAILFTLACACWPAVRPAYSSAIRATGNLLLSSFGGERTARFHETLSQGRQDVRVVLLDHGLRRPEDVVFSSERVGYRPTALCFSLVVSTPRWRKRSRRALAVIFFVQAFVLLRVSLCLLQGYASWIIDGRPALDLGIPLAAIDLLLLWTTTETTSSYLVPLLAWALLLFPPEAFAVRPSPPAGDDEP